MVEIEQRHLKEFIIEHFQFFGRLRYSAYFLSAGKELKPVQDISVEVLKTDHLEDARYINNLVFLLHNGLA